MDDAFWKATAITLAINLVYTVVALLVGVAAVRGVDRYVYTEIDFVEEIKKGNIAAAIYAGVLLLFVAIILSSGLGK
jgi:uncharacterized membrane protein YjfL (UPF0719 family)